ncbi:hypothetical protein K435DRAFT_682111, partial [Dendrothele bispora CBS 962.96]
PLNLPQPDWSLKRTSSDPGHYTSKQAMGQKIKELTRNLSYSEAHMEVLYENQEVYAAQTVIQDMTLMKMNQAVMVKEEEKRSKKHPNFTLPNQGFGQIWTDQKVLEVMQLHEEEKACEEAEAAERVRIRMEKQKAKAEAELKWKRIVEDHKAQVEAWKEECQTQKSRGIKVKDLPPKPKKMTKKVFLALTLGPEGEKDGVEVEGEDNGAVNDKGDETEGSDDDVA